MKAQLFSLDIIAAGLAFILVFLGIYIFLTEFQWEIDKFSLYASRLNEIIFSSDPYFGIIENHTLKNNSDIEGKLIALSSSENFIYRENGKRSYFELYFDPPINVSIYRGTCQNAEKKITFHRYVIDVNNQGHKAILTVCLK